MARQIYEWNGNGHEENLEAYGGRLIIFLLKIIKEAGRISSNELLQELNRPEYCHRHQPYKREWIRKTLNELSREGYVKVIKAPNTVEKFAAKINYPKIEVEKLMSVLKGYGVFPDHQIDDYSDVEQIIVYRALQLRDDGRSRVGASLRSALVELYGVESQKVNAFDTGKRRLEQAHVLYSRQHSHQRLIEVCKEDFLKGRIRYVHNKTLLELRDIPDVCSLLVDRLMNGSYSRVQAIVENTFPLNLMFRLPQLKDGDEKRKYLKQEVERIILSLPADTKMTADELRNKIFKQLKDRLEVASSQVTQLYMDGLNRTGCEREYTTLLEQRYKEGKSLRDLENPLRLSRETISNREEKALKHLQAHLNINKLHEILFAS